MAKVGGKTRSIADIKDAYNLVMFCKFITFSKDSCITYFPYEVDR
jgi:hypothetical protein